jgi:hypothetical protein
MAAARHREAEVLRIYRRCLAPAGLAVGMVCALGLTRLLESQLFAISPRDPVTYIVTPLVLVAVAALATFAPAHRATRVDQ